MAIRPVSAVSFNANNTVNQTNFEGRKKERTNQNTSNPIREKLAVPLAATVLAMSPMASSAKSLNDIDFVDETNIEMVNDIDNINRIEGLNDEKVVGSKTFAGVREGNISYDLKVDLVNTKGGTGYDQIYISRKSPLSSKSSKDIVKGLNKAKISLMSDDGQKGQNFENSTYSYVGSSTAFPLRTDVANYLEGALNSPSYHGNAKVNVTSKGLRQTLSSLQNVPNGNKWANVTKPYDYGKPCGSATLTGDRGDKYTITVYSPDGTDANVNTITVKKANCPELEVIGVVKEKAIFNKGYANEKSLLYGHTMLVSQGKSGREFLSIIDDKLAAGLINILNDSQLDKVRNLLRYYQERTNNYVLFDNGAVMQKSN